MYRDKKISVVVLAYNVEDHIAAVLEAMPDFVDIVYVVDDASADRTADIVRNFALLHSQVDVLAVRQSGQPGTQNTECRTPRVEFIHHQVNRGPGAALSTGYGRAYADGMDIVVKVDGDNQMPLEEMANLIDPLVSGRADYAKGNRLFDAACRREMPRFRLVGNVMLTWLTRIASGNWRVNDPQNGYTAISSHALSAVGQDLYPGYGYLNDLLVRLNVHRLVVTDVPMAARYGSEKSAIRLHRYVPKVSGLLLRLFVGRVSRCCRFRARDIRVGPYCRTDRGGTAEGTGPWA